MSGLVKQTERAARSKRSEKDSPIFAPRKLGQSPDRKSGPSRRGATLIELLVVLGILVLLAGVALPMMRPALEGRRVREAARAVNVYLSAARNRALETRRPAGVMLQRMEAAAGASMILHRVEVSPPYGGDTTTARATVNQPTLGTNAAGETVWSLTATLTDLNQYMVRRGDLIQLNQQGPWYEIVGTFGTNGTLTSSTITLELAYRNGQQLPWPSSQPVPYQILRQPTKSAATPLQLPMTTVVDLGASGIDPGESNPTAAAPGSSFLGTNPVYILFSDKGSLLRIYATRGDGTTHPLDGPVVFPIYLLVGRREKVGETTTGKRNWEDFNNIWITLNPQTGMVTTAPVVASGSDPLPASVYDSRDAARSAYSMGGQ